MMLALPVPGLVRTYRLTSDGDRPPRLELGVLTPNVGRLATCFL